MATNRIIPPAPEQLMPEEAPDNHLAEKELEQKNERKLNTTLRAGAVAQIVVAGARNTRPEQQHTAFSFCGAATICSW